tara:strand:- start:1386 stop:1559 length:174 start_codon:yes stop_codon:yes gene_type:complete
MDIYKKKLTLLDWEQAKLQAEMLIKQATISIINGELLLEEAKKQLKLFPDKAKEKDR